LASRTITNNTAATVFDDVILVDATALVQLPDALTVPGKSITVKNTQLASSPTIKATVQPVAGQTVERQAAMALSGRDAFATFFADGARWLIIATAGNVAGTLSVEDYPMPLSSPEGGA
jgi:hypothetical protein